MEMKIFMRSILWGMSITALLILASCSSSTDNDPQDEFGFIICTKNILSGRDNAVVRINEPMKACTVLARVDGHHAIDPAVSPDGSIVVFSANFEKEEPSLNDAPGGTLFKMSTNGGEYMRITDANWETTSEIAPAFSPDGNKIAYVKTEKSGYYPTYNRIWTMNLDGSNNEPLVDDREIYNQGDPDFSPDGSKIVYTCDKFSLASNVTIVNSDGSGEPVNLTNFESYEHVADNPFFDKTGEWIYYYYVNVSTIEYAVYRVSAGGGTPEKVMDIPQNEDLAGVYFNFSPASNWDGYVFSAIENGKNQIYTTDELKEGMNKNKITISENNYDFPFWWKPAE